MAIAKNPQLVDELMFQVSSAVGNATLQSASQHTIRQHAISIRERIENEGRSADNPLVDGILRLLQWFIDNREAIFEIIDLIT